MDIFTITPMRYGLSTFNTQPGFFFGLFQNFLFAVQNFWVEQPACPSAEFTDHMVTSLELPSLRVRNRNEFLFKDLEIFK